jgi:hypothetical protein
VILMIAKNLISAEPIMHIGDMGSVWKLFIEVLETNKPLARGHRRKNDVKMGIKEIFFVNMGRIICDQDGDW